LIGQQAEIQMKQIPPKSGALRTKAGVIDQRQQQIDPAGKHRTDPNDAAKRSQKQPGQDLRDPQKDTGDAE
jgi:hypothetical protein